MLVNILKNHKNPAVSLPKKVAFPDSVEKVDVLVMGKARVLVPENDVWDVWFDTVDVPPDFMEERGEPEVQNREAL